MTNSEALSLKCTALCSGFYPDGAVLELELTDVGLQASANYIARDRHIAVLAVKIVSSMVESSHSEGGISSSYDRVAVKNNILRCCREFGIEPSEFLTRSTISDASGCW